MLKKIVNYLFNDNVGYFVQEHIYFYEGRPYIGYVVCQGFRFFGIYGYTRIVHTPDKETLIEDITRLKLPITI